MMHGLPPSPSLLRHISCLLPCARFACSFSFIMAGKAALFFFFCSTHTHLRKKKKKTVKTGQRRRTFVVLFCWIERGIPLTILLTHIIYILYGTAVNKAPYYCCSRSSIYTRLQFLTETPLGASPPYAPRYRIYEPRQPSPTEVDQKHYNCCAIHHAAAAAAATINLCPPSLVAVSPPRPTCTRSTRSDTRRQSTGRPRRTRSATGPDLWPRCPWR